MSRLKKKPVSGKMGRRADCHLNLFIDIGQTFYLVFKPVICLVESVGKVILDVNPGLLNIAILDKVKIV